MWPHSFGSCEASKPNFRRNAHILPSASLTAHNAASEGKGGGMNKNLLITWVVVFVVWMVGSYIVHGTLLHDDYAALSSLFRSEQDAQQHMPFLIAAHVILAGAFSWIYLRGQEARPWLSQGLRYGLAVALLTVIPTYIIYYVVQPMPGATVVKQIVFDTALLLILGAVAAFVNRGRVRA